MLHHTDCSMSRELLMGYRCRRQEQNVAEGEKGQQSLCAAKDLC